MSDILNIDDALDCDSIKQKIQKLEEAKNYSNDFRAEINEKIAILRRREAELDC